MQTYCTRSKCCPYKECEYNTATIPPLASSEHCLKSYYMQEPDKCRLRREDGRAYKWKKYK